MCHLLVQQHEQALLHALVAHNPQVADDESALLQSVQARFHTPHQHLIAAQVLFFCQLLQVSLPQHRHLQKEKKRKDYTFWLDEKPGDIPGCPTQMIAHAVSSSKGEDQEDVGEQRS